MLKERSGWRTVWNGAQSVALSSDGKHAYVTSNWGDAVSWYQINQIDGSMRRVLGNGEDYNVTLDDETHYIQVQASYVDGTGSRNWINSQPYYIRSTPLILSTINTLSLVENLPIGSLVGEFNASDPEYNSNLSFHLVSGIGDGNNSLFTLETNGTPRTATTFDYESNPTTYSIRVSAKDEFNATVEGITLLIITLTDVFEDADGDGFSDQYEAFFKCGTDPANPSDKPGINDGLLGYWHTGREYSAICPRMKEMAQIYGGASFQNGAVVHHGTVRLSFDGSE